MKGLLESLRGAALDVGRAVREPGARAPYVDLLRHTPAFARLLPAVARSAAGFTLVHAAADNAARRGDALAMVMDDTRWSWADLERIVSGAAHILHDAGVRRGVVVAVVAANSPAYVALVLALGRVGAVSALVNPALAETSALAHALTAASAEYTITDRELVTDGPRLRVAKLIESARAVDRAPFPLSRGKRDEDFIYIYTSGTTGLPKPCRIGHARATMAGAAAAELGYRFRRHDLLYCVLPLFHANALLLGAGACIMSGTPMALRDGFSARAFWPDVERYGATAFNYIGELGRYIAESEHSPSGPHRLRVAFGNGLRPAAWETLKERFGIETIREFYAATESPGGLINFSERPGSIGHLPLRRIGWLRLARYDVGAGELVRDENGFFIDCEVGEPGELLVRMAPKGGLFRSAATEFRGYTDGEASRAKILEDCFRTGDRFFRSGDLLRYDSQDYFYFVDRLGDTFRWKGENISTQEVVNLFAPLPVRSVAVVGAEVPGHEGRAGLAAIEPEGELGACIAAIASADFPPQARPRFLRIVKAQQATATHKTKTATLRNEGADPRRVSDPLYYWDGRTYRQLGAAEWAKIEDGTTRL